MCRPIKNSENARNKYVHSTWGSRTLSRRKKKQGMHKYKAAPTIHNTENLGSCNCTGGRLVVCIKITPPTINQTVNSHHLRLNPRNKPKGSRIQLRPTGVQ